jgi:hypothetical protein
MWSSMKKVVSRFRACLARTGEAAANAAATPKKLKAIRLIGVAPCWSTSR